MNQKRNDQILKLIVEDFIETAEPVGSQTLLERHGLDCSSATIRNVMASLEAEGLIEKPHHSAGRVPSTKGYKYYLSRLKDFNGYEVDDEFKKEFSMILQKKSQTVEDVMEKSCQILSEMTNLATVVLGPESSQDHLASIQVVPLSSQALTAIIVTDKGYVENKTFTIDDGLAMSDLEQAVKMLNKRLVGTAIEDLSERMMALKPLVTDLLGDRTNMIMEAFAEAFLKFAKKKLETFGTSKLLSLPEYENDKQKLVEVVKLLDSPEALNDQLNDLKEEQVKVHEDQNMAIVAKDVSINGLETGTIAVVGPKRMNYRKILASLEYVAKTLSKYFGSEEEKEEEDE